MKTTDYQKLYQFAYVKGGWIPENQKALDLSEQTPEGTVVSFTEATDRDLKFHACYFKLLKYIWDLMPGKFHADVQSGKFYGWLKHLRGEYDVVFEFNDGTKMIEYHSVSFGKMTQIEFETYVREQLPWIYGSVMGLCYKGDQYDRILEDVETEFETFLRQL